ncbi:MAG: hypothetical protein L3K03_08550 [Thermoplasmata archaeon]|nr:hypothetical protein [Thermoplasmata archaeon]
MSPATSSQSVAYRPDSRVGELPILVGIMAILIGLFGIFWIVVGVLLLLAGLGILVAPAFVAFSWVGSSVVVAGAITLIFGAILLAVATGLWDLETWALYLTGIVLAGIIGLLVLASSFGLGLVLAVVLLVYLVAVSPHFY